jgi:hypothetical protein
LAFIDKKTTEPQRHGGDIGEEWKKMRREKENDDEEETGQYYASVSIFPLRLKSLFSLLTLCLCASVVQFS